MAQNQKLNDVLLLLALPQPGDKCTEPRRLVHITQRQSRPSGNDSWWHTSGFFSLSRFAMFSGDVQSSCPDSWHPTESMSHARTAVPREDKDARFILLSAKGPLLLSVRSNACSSPSLRPNRLEGDFDVVRGSCMLMPGVWTCQQAVCETSH